MPLSKKYVLDQIASADPEDHKSSVKLATTQSLAAYTRVGNTITANANGAMAAQDGVVPVDGDEILLLHGAAPADNGVYTVVEAGSISVPFQLVRRADADRTEFVSSGMRVPVAAGVRYGGKGTEFVLVTPDPIVLNTTSLDFEEVKGGGSGTVTKIDNGDAVEVPEGRQMIHAEDVDIEDGDLDVEGDVLSQRAESNYLIERVPPRSLRRIPRHDVAHFTGVLSVQGLLQVYGTLRDVTPDTGQTILNKLGDVLPPDHLIFGGNSPAVTRSPAQARAVLQVPTTAEVQAMLGMSIGDVIHAVDFAAEVNVYNLWDTDVSLTATLPLAPEDNTRVAFAGDPTNGISGSLTVDAGANVLGIASGPTSGPLPGRMVQFPVVFQFQQTSGPGVGIWRFVDIDFVLLMMSSGSGVVPASKTTGPGVVSLSPDTLVGLKDGDANPTAVAFSDVHPNWAPKLTGPGPHTLLIGKVNLFHNDTGIPSGMVLHLPDPLAINFVEVEIKEANGVSTSVVVTTAGGVTSIEDAATGAIVTSYTLGVSRCWVKYKWDDLDSVWRVVGKAFV